MDEESARVFLPSRERCFKRLRFARFGETVKYVHCRVTPSSNGERPIRTPSSTGARSVRPTSMTSIGVRFAKFHCLPGETIYDGGLTNNMARSRQVKSRHGRKKPKPGRERTSSEFDEAREENRFERYEWIFEPEQPQLGSGESVHCRGETVGKWQEPESLY